MLYTSDGRVLLIFFSFLAKNLACDVVSSPTMVAWGFFFFLSCTGSGGVLGAGCLTYLPASPEAVAVSLGYPSPEGWPISQTGLHE